MKKMPKVGDKVCIKGHKSLPFEVVEVVRSRPAPVRLQHPLSGTTMTFRLKELSPSCR